MLIGIIYSTEKKVIGKLAEGLRKGLEEQGHIVKMFPDNSGTLSGLASCKNIFMGSYVTSALKAKTPPRLREVLSKASGIVGKRSIAFIGKSGMGERKALASLMNDMEKEGCYIIDQRIFSSEEDAYKFGKTVSLKP